MIQFNIKRDELLKPLQMVSNVPEKRQTLPILSHLLLTVTSGKIFITATDLEIAIESYAPLAQDSDMTEGKITLPGRKLLDICRNLPTGAMLEFVEEENRCLISSGASQFSLATLPASNFPSFDEKDQDYTEIVIKQKELHRLIQSTVFAIAQKDVRYYLNGMLLEISGNQLTFVATDGHRLALNRLIMPTEVQKKISVIIPRKGVIELIRLLSNQAEEVNIKLLLNPRHIVVKCADFNFISRLIEGQFPNYEQVIPQQEDKLFRVDRNMLKQALVRVSILSNERLPGVSMQLRRNNLSLMAKNSEKEEAREEISIDYQSDDIKVSFNATYLIEVLNVIPSDFVILTFFSSSSAFLVKEGVENLGWLSLFVIMPMRL